MKELNEIKSLMKEYQEQTRDNFSDVNDDIDDIRGHLVNIEQLLNQIIKGKEGESNE